MTVEKVIVICSFLCILAASTTVVIVFGNMPGQKNEIDDLKNNLDITPQESVNYIATDDTYIIKANEDSNYGTSTRMQVRNDVGSSSGGYAHEALIQFDISDYSKNVHEATLNVYYYGYSDKSPSGEDMYCFRNEGSWDESTVTWNNAPSYAATATATYTMPSSKGQWISFDVTEDVQDFVNGSKTNYGWRLQNELWGSINIPVVRLYSKEYDSGSYAPYLEIQNRVLTIQTNESTGIGETNATIHGYLEDDNGKESIIWMEWSDDKSFSNIENIWSSNTSLKNGLGDIGSNSAPEFFKDGGNWHVIAGEYAGNYNGFTWNGSIWVTNSTIISGLTDASNHAVIETFMLDGNLQAISTGSEENFYGYEWNGAGWDANSSLVNGLSSISYDSPTPTIFNDGGVTQMISGSLNSGFYGYDWNGSSWVSNSSVVNGLGDPGNNLAPEFFTINNVSRLISGVWNGALYGWAWNGSAWNEDNMISEGLSVGINTYDGMMPKYTIFNESGWKAIAGRTPGNFYAFDLQMDEKGSEISIEITGLTPGQLYWYRAAGENILGREYGEEKAFLTLPETASSISTTILSNASINLSWTKGNGANNTIIERNSYAGWNFGEGIEIYNGTGSNYIDDGTSFGNTYYYQVWSQANWTYNPTIYQLSDNYLATDITTVFAPNVSTNHTTGVEERNATLHGYLGYDGEENCSVWFEYGKNTSFINTEKNTYNKTIPTSNNYSTFRYDQTKTLIGNCSLRYRRRHADYPPTPYNNSFDGDWDSFVGVFVGETSLGWHEARFYENYTHIPKSDNNTLSIKYFIRHTCEASYSTKIRARAYNWTTNSWDLIFNDNLQHGTISNISETMLPIQTISENGTVRTRIDIEVRQWSSNDYSEARYFESKINHPEVKGSNETFQKDINNLDPGKLYWYRAVAKNSKSTTYGENRTFLTKPETPNNVTYFIINESAVNISWSSGAGANNTILERKTTEGPWQKGTGEELYNGTGTYYIDTNVSRGNTYYYQVWSQANWTYNPTVYSLSSENTSFNLSMEVEDINVSTEDAEYIHVNNATLAGHIDGLATSTIAHGDLEYDGWLNYASGTNEGWRKHAIKVNATDLAGKDGEYITKIGAYIHTDATSIALIEGGSNPDNGNELRSVNISSYDTGWMEVDISPVLINLSTWYWVEVAQPPWASNNGPTGYDANAVVAGSDQSTRSAWTVSYGDGSWPEPNPDIWHDMNNYWVVGSHARAMNIYMVAEGGNTFFENCTAWFEWGKTPALGNRTANQTVESDAAFYQYIEGLEANTTYFYQAFGNNSNYSSNGTIKNFTTQPYFGPVLSDESPLDDHNNVAVNLTQLQINITDPDDTMVSWEIETSPNIGSASGTDDTEGRKNCTITTLLDANTTYQWFVNATDGLSWTNETYTFTTSNMPEMGNELPENNSYAPVQPDCSIDIFDNNNDSVHAIFYENTTGSWIQQYEATIDTTTTNSITWSNYTNATEKGEAYWWKVNITDNKGNYNESIYQFIVKRDISISNLEPYHTEKNIELTIDQIRVTLSDPDNQTFNWTIETSPDIGSTGANNDDSGMKSCSILGVEAETIYTWYLNITNPQYTIQNTYNFTTTFPPYVAMESPANQSNSSLQPVCSIRAYDVEASTLSVDFYENSTGDWIQTYGEEGIQVLGGNHYQTISWNKYYTANTYATTYWWKVVIEDDKGATNSSIFHFTTQDQAPEVTNEQPTNGSTNIDIALDSLSAHIEDAEDHEMSWSIETSPDIGNNSGTRLTAGTIATSISGLSENKTYYWYVNVSDGYRWTNETFSFNTSEKPMVYNPYPTNGSDVGPQPICEISVLDTKDGQVTVTFAENTSGAWTDQYEATVDAHTEQVLWWTYTNASAINQTYWWKITATNELNATSTAIYHFTTDDSPVITAPNPTDKAQNHKVNITELSVYLSDPNSDSISWSIETSPHIGNATGITTNTTVNCSVSGLLPGTQYNWYVNASDGDDWTNKSYSFNTSHMFTIEEAKPQGEGAAMVQSACTVRINDPDGDIGTVKFYENTTGSFILQYTNTSAIFDGLAEIKWPEYSNATDYETTYWWMVNITDGKGNFKQIIYNYTTMENMPPQYSAENPYNGSTIEPNINQLSFYIFDFENETINYTIESTPYFNNYNVTGVNYSSSFQQLSIDVQPNTSYIWYLNATDGTNWARYWLTFSTSYNNQSEMSNPNPENGTTNIHLNRSNVSIYLYDRDGDQLRNIIETNPNVGNENTGFHDNGTYSCDIVGLIPGTWYTWYVNITDGGFWNRQWFRFRTSYTPTIESIFPTNNSIGSLDIQPTCQITIDDEDNDPENITVRWYDNSSGIWELQQTNENILSLPATIGYQYTGADAYNTTYWWKVNISDGRGCFNESLMKFTTKINEAPQITPNPANNSTNIDLERSTIEIEIIDNENHPVNWSIETVPDVGLATGVNQSVGTKVCSIDNLLADTTYTWYVNVTDKYNATTREVFYFNTSQAPVLSNEFPVNNSLAPHQTNCSIDVIDPDGGSVSVTFYEANGSTWIEKYTTVISADEMQTVIWNYFSNASIRGDNYRWKVCAEDEKHANTTVIYNFTVNRLIQTTNETPANYQINVDLLIGQVSVNLSDQDNQTINWTIETAPALGTATGDAEGNGTKICSISNLTTNMTYYWWINATDGVESISERYEFSTGNMTVIRNETPAHLSTNVPLRPSCTITVNDPDNDTVTVEFYEEQSGSWVLMQRNSSINATNDVIVRWMEFTNASAYDTTYQWTVVVRDTKNAINVRTYEFTTVQDQLPQINSSTPANGEDNIARTISSIDVDIWDAEDHRMNWTIETTPAIGSASGTNESSGMISCPVSGLACETTYVWYLNISDGYRSIQYVNSFEVAQKPRLIEPRPENGELYISRRPACNVTAYDPGDNRIDVTIYEYQSGSWIPHVQETNLNGSQLNNIVWAEYSNASLFNTTYQWKVVAENDKGCSEEEIYSFITRRDWIAPTIHWVNVTPSEVQVGMPISFSAQVTDEGGTVDEVKLCLSSIGSNVSMIPIGNNTYRYITNFSTEGNYVFYILATDEEGNSVTSDFHSFEILVKVLTVRMHALERVLRDTQNELLIQISHAKKGTQVTGIENNISVYVSNPEGIRIIDGDHPTEIEDGLYTIPFNHSNESGTYTAWALIEYNDSEYIDATSFELRVEEHYNVSGLTDRMEDVYAATSQKSYNSTEEIISHLRQVGIETGALEQETEKFGISGQFLDTAISTIFQWIFMTLFLLGIFIVGTFVYGRRKGSKLAKRAANVPKAVVSAFTN